MRGPRWGGEGVVPDESQNPQRIAELADILWAHIRGLDQVRLLSSTFAPLRGVRLADKPLPPSCRAGYLGGGRQGIEDRFL
jgi:hypothetical protein